MLESWRDAPDRLQPARSFGAVAALQIARPFRYTLCKMAGSTASPLQQRFIGDSQRRRSSDLYPEASPMDHFVRLGIEVSKSIRHLLPPQHFLRLPGSLQSTVNVFFIQSTSTGPSEITQWRWLGLSFPRPDEVGSLVDSGARGFPAAKERRNFVAGRRSI